MLFINIILDAMPLGRGERQMNTSRYLSQVAIFAIVNVSIVVVILVHFRNSF